MLVPLLLSLTVGSAALGLFVYRAVERDQFRTVDGEVSRALAAAVGRLGNPARPSRTPVDDAEVIEAPIQYVVSADGTVLDRPETRDVVSEAQLAELVDSGAVATIDGEPRYRAQAFVTPRGTAAVTGVSLRTVDESLASLRRNLALGGAVLVAIQALIVALVARRVTDPVVRLSGVAHQIASGDFAAEVGSPAGPRETAALTSDLTAMLGRLLEAIDERERSAADAEQARADMERFMADASHELRTPLTAIRGYSDLYRSGMLDTDGLDRAMSRIGDESERLTTLVGDLLHLVQPADPRHLEAVELAALASAVVHDLRAAHPTHPIAHRLDDSDGCIVRGDAARLHQAVLNLGANACQHTPPGTEIVIAVSTDSATAVLEVIDHGPGIDPELAERIFQPFTRGETSRSRSKHDGAGLGLALADRIVRQHSGSLTLEPTTGGGATFMIRLKLDPGSTNL